MLGTGWQKRRAVVVSCYDTVEKKYSVEHKIHQEEKFVSSIVLLSE